MAATKGWNKSDVINHMVESSGLTKAGATTATEAFLKAIGVGLEQAGSVQLIGFGNFEKRKRSGRNGRNPQTGEQIEIPESTVAAFKAAKGLNERMAASEKN